MIWFPCPLSCAPRGNQYVCREVDRAHEIVSRRIEVEHADHNERREVEMLLIRCGNCGHAHEVDEGLYNAAAEEMVRRAQRSGRAHLTKYPRIEACTGEVVKSREHEAEVVQAMGYHSAEHGVNERFDDEDVERIRDKTRQQNNKRRELQKRRAAFARS